jgi:hypothetical protein
VAKTVLLTYSHLDIMADTYRYAIEAGIEELTAHGLCLLFRREQSVTDKEAVEQVLVFQVQ